MATSGRGLQPEGTLDIVQHSLKPISTKPKPPSGVSLVLTDSPFQPSSQSHVAALASLLQHGSSDLTLAKAASAPATPVLPDSPYQPSSNKHVAHLARAYTGQANNNSSLKPSTPQHKPVLADSGDFQPGSRSYVAELISQVTGRLQAQTNGSSSRPNAQQLLEDLPNSKPHVSELVKSLKKTIDGLAENSSSSKWPGPLHGSTPHNTPLAGKVAGTSFTQQQKASHADQMQPIPQQPLSSEPAAAHGLDTIQLAYAKTAPCKRA
ncbi:hypothetical protein COO60DRAFT_1459338 [Scenedesmus sp. NREL 46B-D3]|nr:hypothetical protein COO60DRAFT_1459338 [Scenedesmus sp. NREL 46B-D3]